MVGGWRKKDEGERKTGEGEWGERRGREREGDRGVKEKERVKRDEGGEKGRRVG